LHRIARVGCRDGGWIDKSNACREACVDPPVLLESEIPPMGRSLRSGGQVGGVDNNRLTQEKEDEVQKEEGRRKRWNRGRNTIEKNMTEEKKKGEKRKRR